MHLFLPQIFVQRRTKSEEFCLFWVGIALESFWVSLYFEASILLVRSDVTQTFSDGVSGCFCLFKE